MCPSHVGVTGIGRERHWPRSAGDYWSKLLPVRWMLAKLF